MTKTTLQEEQLSKENFLKKKRNLDSDRVGEKKWTYLWLNNSSPHESMKVERANFVFKKEYIFIYICVCVYVFVMIEMCFYIAASTHFVFFMISFFSVLFLNEIIVFLHSLFHESRKSFAFFSYFNWT